MMLTTKNSALHTAKEDQKVIIKLWNDSGKQIHDVSISCADEKYSDKVIMDIGATRCPADSEFPYEDFDRSHEIEMKAGDEIIGSAGTEGAIRFQVDIL